jgi:Mg-chelatase subunit ChlD
MVIDLTDGDVAQPRFVTFVIDASGSMLSDDKIGTAIEGIKMVAKKLKEWDAVAVIAFNTEVQGKIVPPRDVPEVNWAEAEAEVRKAVHGPQNGGTALYDAISFAIDRLAKSKRQAKYKDHQRFVVVLTDGEDNSSKKTVQEVRTRPSAFLFLLTFCLFLLCRVSAAAA